MENIPNYLHPDIKMSDKLYILLKQHEEKSMLTAKKYFTSRILVFTILELNTIYVIGYTGDMFIEGNYSFFIDVSLFTLLLYTLALPIIGYMIHRFLGKRVAWNIARVILDDHPEFFMLAEDTTKSNPTLVHEVEILKDEFNSTVNRMSEYDSTSVLVNYNYFIVFAFIVLIVLSHYTKIDIAIYSFYESILLITLSVSSYLLSTKGKKKIAKMLKSLQSMSVKI